MSVIYSIVESPLHPDMQQCAAAGDASYHTFNSIRKAITSLKKSPPDIVLADFVYGYGNNYAGVNISNLDVFLYSLQKYSPMASVIVFCEKAENHYATKLTGLFKIDLLEVYPVDTGKLCAQIQSLLKEK